MTRLERSGSRKTGLARQSMLGIINAPPINLQRFDISFVGIRADFGGAK